MAAPNVEKNMGKRPITAAVSLAWATTFALGAGCGSVPGSRTFVHVGKDGSTEPDSAPSNGGTHATGGEPSTGGVTPTGGTSATGGTSGCVVGGLVRGCVYPTGGASSSGGTTASTGGTNAASGECSQFRVVYQDRVAPQGRAERARLMLDSGAAWPSHGYLREGFRRPRTLRAVWGRQYGLPEDLQLRRVRLLDLSIHVLRFFEIALNRTSHRGRRPFYR